MADHHKHNSSHEGYEKTDAKPVPLILFTVGLAILCIISFLSMAIMFKVMENYENAKDVPSGYVRDSRWTAPGVQLEVHPSRLIEELHRLEKEQLTTYAWIDPVAGKVRIPVERAIQLMAGKGFPHREGLDAAVEGSASLTESGGKKSFAY